MKPLLRPTGIFIALIIFTSCLDGPKSKEPYTITRTLDKSILDPDVSREMRKVEVTEVISGDKYNYALVKEDDRSFWISTQKKEIKTGDIYYFNESILKTNFESKELSRVFDTLYLVTSLVPEAHGQDMHGFSKSPIDQEQVKTIEKSIADQQDSSAVFSGRIKIADLVDNPEKYEGKKVELKGAVTKVNEGIMGRNWIHLQDGSKDSYDLVITTSEPVKKGKTITVRALVQLNVDLGSGYSYPILLENGSILKTSFH
ncbi:GW dipeptide domain-containing protein [Muriicola marianensis]|uniref:GW domain-containing protein n=1 Tax=Muriicola marianensis TaxID=1324801 RepID=A0ABQ1R6N0_9FLAO|nr:GW dipeptide domain-containing protein [Muriicola marianensis]GGD57898.1 hypothetical protein GCM10011361_25460 [Muriicola marianensis]